MYTLEALLDIHERVHQNLKDLIAHCSKLEPGAADRKVEGFADWTVRLHVHHGLGAERYWMGVLQGWVDADDDSAEYLLMADLETLRAEVFESTRSFLRSLDEDALNTPRHVILWNGSEADLRPAHVLLRTQMHYYHHNGLVLAMCRAMGHPGSGIDFPIR